MTTLSVLLCFSLVHGRCFTVMTDAAKPTKPMILQQSGKMMNSQAPLSAEEFTKLEVEARSLFKTLSYAAPTKNNRCRDEMRQKLKGEAEPRVLCLEKIKKSDDEKLAKFTELLSNASSKK